MIGVSARADLPTDKFSLARLGLDARNHTPRAIAQAAAPGVSPFRVIPKRAWRRLVHPLHWEDGFGCPEPTKETACNDLWSRRIQSGGPAFGAADPRSRPRWRDDGRRRSAAPGAELLGQCPRSCVAAEPRRGDHRYPAGVR